MSAPHSLAPVGGVSHVIGDRSRPLLQLTIPQVLARTTAANGPRDAAVFTGQGKRFTRAMTLGGKRWFL